jgi:hypothetical protein
MAKRIAWSPDRQRIFTKNGRICTACCFIPQFSAHDCRVFTDPNPPAWDPEVIYTLKECVSYGGRNYYSTSDTNLNHVPGTDDKWATYDSCGNDNWNSRPPFGGIGRTPAFYAISARIEQNYVYNDGYYGCSPSLTRKFILDGFGIAPADPVNYCLWRGNTSQSYYYNDILDFPTCSKTPDIQHDNPYYIGIIFNCSTYAVQTSVGFYGSWWDITIDGIELAGFESRVRQTIYQDYVMDEVFTISWRPVDCNYTLWKISVDYNTGDCVAWKGNFYRACKPSGPNHGGPVEPEETDPIFCTGANYWRRVE